MLSSGVGSLALNIVVFFFVKMFSGVGSIAPGPDFFWDRIHGFKTRFVLSEYLSVNCLIYCLVNVAGL